MKRLARAALVLALALSARAAGAVCPHTAPTGTIHYFCACGAGAQAGCVAGSDAANGLTPATAKQTFATAVALFGTMPAGDGIEFCNGGSWTATGTAWVNSSSTASSRAYVMPYTATWGGGGFAPIIITPTSTFSFSMSHGSTTSTPVGGYVFNGLHITGDGSTGEAFFIYNQVNDVEMCGNEIDNVSIGHDNSGGNQPEYHNSNLVFVQNYVHDCPGQGYLGIDDGTVVGENTFTNNGSARALLNHNIYGGTRNTADGAIYRNNVLTKAAWTSGTGCQGASFTIHGTGITNLTVTGNTVTEALGTIDPGCWGIAIAPGYPDVSESNTHVRIAGNIVGNVGNESIICGSCIDATIENNVAYNFQNVNDVMIKVPDDEATAAPADFLSDQVRVRNNSVAADRGTGIFLGNEGTHHTVVNNAIKITGTSGTRVCFNLNLSASAYDADDYNDCFVAGTGGIWEGSTSTATRATWCTNRSADCNSKTTDPAFISLSSPYSLAVLGTSPLVGAGNATYGATVDFSGVARGTPRDIGAYQFVSGGGPAGKPASEIFIFLSQADGLLRVRW